MMIIIIMILIIIIVIIIVIIIIIIKTLGVLAWLLMSGTTRQIKSNPIKSNVCF